MTMGVRDLAMFERYLECTQPRLRPALTSHHRQSLVQPCTRTEVRAGIQPTRGNTRSGPARMFTLLLVNVVCASAFSGSARATASRNARPVAVTNGVSERRATPSAAYEIVPMVRAHYHFFPVQVIGSRPVFLMVGADPGEQRNWTSSLPAAASLACTAMPAENTAYC